MITMTTTTIIVIFDQVQHRGVIYGGRHLLPLRSPHRLPRRLSSRQVPLLSFLLFILSFFAGLVCQKFYHSNLPSVKVDLFQKVPVWIRQPLPCALSKQVQLLSLFSYQKRFSCFHQTNHYWPQEWCLVWDDILTFGNFHPSIHGFNKTLFGQQITLALSYIFIIDVVGVGHLWPKLSLLKKIVLGQDVHLNKGLQTNFNENERNVWCEDISHIFSKHTIVA